MKIGAPDIASLQSQRELIDPRKINVFLGEALPVVVGVISERTESTNSDGGQELSPPPDELQAPAWLKKRSHKRKSQPPTPP